MLPMTALITESVVGSDAIKYCHRYYEGIFKMLGAVLVDIIQRLGPSGLADFRALQRCRAALNGVYLNLCGWSRRRNDMARKPITPTTSEAFGWALAEELSLRVVSAGKDQGSWLHRKPLVSGASADQVPSR
jgi:hypothetical protein